MGADKQSSAVVSGAGTSSRQDFATKVERGWPGVAKSGHTTLRTEDRWLRMSYFRRWGKRIMHPLASSNRVKLGARSACQKVMPVAVAAKVGSEA
jgi:hypothetical protein